MEVKQRSTVSGQHLYIALFSTHTILNVLILVLSQDKTTD